ncbi:MAG: molecular chaperone TorD family protein [Burkholderiaceae bacterium]
MRGLPRDRHDGDEERNFDLRREEVNAMTETETIALSSEDQGRANLYALLARLMYAGADAGLLRSLADAVEMFEGEGPLPIAWRKLAAAAARTNAGASVADFDATFVGVGKAPVTPYLSHYMVSSGHEKVLVDLRDELRELGLVRDAKAVEPEDHVAALLEVMRHLIARGDSDESLAAQQAFFGRFVAPGYRGFCDAARQVELSEFYQGTIDVVDAFLQAEVEQFEMS